MITNCNLFVAFTGVKFVTFTEKNSLKMLDFMRKTAYNQQDDKKYQCRQINVKRLQNVTTER